MAPVIPPVMLADQEKGHRQPAGGARRRPPLPLPVLPAPPAGSMVYGVAAIDVSGRIADRTIIRALGWAPGTRLHVRECSGVIVVRVDGQGSSPSPVKGACICRWRCGSGAG
ncbi:hypothetical protein GCM10011608_61470 [Micromonospora sonchi]|uniref:Uncharacterized protein n=1 Tax=Micromonospora sonchi TaxID=1763543 RepID=A0A917UCA1_9ACTN|nr:hypothetical protein GCM10011608_61470 [Micromonospora sonchi]